MAFVEDLSNFINAETPGYVSATIGSAAVGGIFDNGFVDLGGLVSSEKVFTCKTADIPGLVYGGTVTIATVDYTVAEVHPDGTGISRVLLK